MADKKIKIPGFYKKTLTERQLERRYLRYLEQPTDKSYLRSCYAKDEEGFILRQDLAEKDAEKLGVLKKAIKGNQKFAVKFLPLTVMGALIAGGIFFFTVMANPLLQRALERGLEAIFEARVNASGFRISLLNFEIAMDGLTIADRDAPMRNLIQFDRMRIKLLPQALLRGRVYIEEIRADRIRFGTPRTVSGAIPGRPPRERPPQEPMEIPQLIDFENFDPLAILMMEYDKLLSPRLYGTIMGAYEESAARWKTEEALARARAEELQSRAQPFLNINVNDYLVLDIATVDLIRSTVNDVNAMISSVQGAQEDIQRIIGTAQDDINTIRSLEEEARHAFTSDFNHLRSFLDLSSGAAVDLLSVIVMSLLTETAEEYINYGLRALELLEQLKELQAKLPQSAPRPPREERYRGRDVIFPTVQYPRFYLGVLATDVLTPSDWHWGFDLRSVSSDPEFAARPTSLALTLAETGDGLQRTGAFRGQADFRAAARERFSVDLSGGGFPMDISLDNFGIGGIQGGVSFSAQVTGMTGGNFNAGGDIRLAQAGLTNPANTFAQAADQAIRQVNAVDLELLYEHRQEDRDRFSMTSNITEILRIAMEQLIAQYRREAEEALERALRGLIDQFIEDSFLNREDLELAIGAIMDHQNTMNQIRGALDQKRSELEARARGAVDDVTRQVEEAARQAAQEAAQQATDQVRDQAQEAIQNIIPSVPIPTPSIPNPFGR